MSEILQLNESGRAGYFRWTSSAAIYDPTPAPTAVIVALDGSQSAITLTKQGATTTTRFYPDLSEAAPGLYEIIASTSDANADCAAFSVQVRIGQTWLQYLTADLLTLTNKIGAFTGTGVNTVLGFLRAMSRSDLAAPSDIGGTYDPVTDSLQAISDAVASGSDPLLNPVPGAYAVGTAGYDIGQIPAIKAKTDLITSGSVTIANPVNPASLALTLYSNVDYLPTSGATLPTWTSADWSVYGLATAASVILYYADTNSTVDTALGTMVVDSATSIHLTATAAQVFAVPLGENVVGYKIIAVLDVAHGSVEVQLANASLSHLNYNLYAEFSNPNTTP